MAKAVPDSRTPRRFMKVIAATTSSVDETR